MGLIHVEHLTKRYNFYPIIKDFNFTFQEGLNYAVKGANGSGKSTLINLLTGYLSPSTGTINYCVENKKVERNSIYKYISISSPYTSLIEDLSLAENFDFFKKFKSIQKEVTYTDLLTILDWKDPMEKPYAKFSSGMKQKASLAFSFLSASPILFLDEPTSFLDARAKEWYRSSFKEYTQNRSVILASNDDIDFVDIHEVIRL